MSISHPEFRFLRELRLSTCWGMKMKYLCTQYGGRLRADRERGQQCLNMLIKRLNVVYISVMNLDNCTFLVL